MGVALRDLEFRGEIGIILKRFFFFLPKMKRVVENDLRSKEIQ